MGFEKNRNKAIVFLTIVLIIPFVYSINDPGHDTLYIEEQGDSELNGTFNVSLNVTTRGGSTTLLDYLTILTKTTPSSFGTASVISATANTLYIDSPGNVLLNSLTNDGTIFLGSTGDTVNLNITGALYVLSSTAQANGQNICLEDGTNCPAETGTGDINSVQTDNTYVYNGSDTGQVYLRFNETKLNSTIDARA